MTAGHRDLLGAAPPRSGAAPFNSHRAWVDKLGVCLSAGCALHCLAAPFVLVAMAGAGLELAGGDWWHSLFLLTTAGLGAASFCCSYRRHRKARIWPIFGAALAFLAAGRFAGEGPHEALLTAVGGTILALSHFLNHRWCSRTAASKAARLEL